MTVIITQHLSKLPCLECGNAILCNVGSLLASRRQLHPGLQIKGVGIFWIDWGFGHFPDPLGCCTSSVPVSLLCPLCARNKSLEKLSPCLAIANDVMCQSRSNASLRHPSQHRLFCIPCRYHHNIYQQKNIRRSGALGSCGLSSFFRSFFSSPNLPMALGKPFPKKLPGEQGFLAAILIALLVAWPPQTLWQFLYRFSSKFSYAKCKKLWIIALKLFKSSFEKLCTCTRGIPAWGDPKGLRFVDLIRLKYTYDLHIFRS